MTADMYIFAKKPNSTKRPTDETFKKTINNVTLNESTNIVNPIFIFTQPVGIVDKMYSFNYIYVTDLARYYFVNNWTYESGRWLASCTIDALATYKHDIGQQRTYIARCSARYDGSITDNAYPVTNTVSLKLTAVASGLKTNYEAGTYIIGVYSGDTEAIGSVVYYALNNTQMRALNNKLMGNIDWMYTGVTEISEELFKTFSNPMQYISSCLWYPFDTTEIPGTVTNEIKYGYWSFNVSAKKLDSALWVGKSYTLENIPKHPQKDRGDYLNNPPYSKYWFNWPLTGTIALDPNIIANSTSLEILLYTDIANGKGVLYFMHPATTATLLTMEVQVGVPFDMSMTASQGVGGGLVNAVGSYLGAQMPEVMGSVLGEGGGSLYGATFTAISSSLGMSSPVVTSSGSRGSALSFMGYPELCAEFFLLSEEDQFNVGRPYCKVDLISACPGFIKTANNRIVLLCTSEELKIVRDYMDSGFYYE